MRIIQQIKAERNYPGVFYGEGFRLYHLKSKEDFPPCSCVYWFWVIFNRPYFCSSHLFCSALSVCHIHLLLCHIAYNHCVKSAQIRSFFWSVLSCIQSEYRPEKTRTLFTQWIKVKILVTQIWPTYSYSTGFDGLLVQFLIHCHNILVNNLRYIISWVNFAGIFISLNQHLINNVW